MTYLTKYSPNRLMVRRSRYCAYCGAAFSRPSDGEAEHVIGRRFVPKGTLAAQWNLIVRACGPCNDHKADLENDISAITMQPDAWGRYPVDDPNYITEAVRKARTRNRRTGRMVSELESPIEIKQDFGGLQMAMSFTGPAQADESRMFELARLQLAGFFSMLTYNDEAKRGWWWTGAFSPVVAVPRGDWGHPHLVWINQMSSNWEYRLFALAADGFYKIWIRRHEGEPAVWAWVIEWNRNYRLAGFFGDPEVLEALTVDGPRLVKHVVYEGPNGWMRMREETPLAESDDTMFTDPIAPIEI